VQRRQRRPGRVRAVRLQQPEAAERHGVRALRHHHRRRRGGGGGGLAAGRLPPPSDRPGGRARRVARVAPVYNLTWAVVLVPLGGALLAYLPESARNAARVCIATTAISFVLSLLVLAYRLGHLHAAPYESLITFWSFNPAQPIGGGVVNNFTAQAGILVDGLSASILP